MDILDGLSSFLMLSNDDINNFASTCPHRYKKYEIPKRNGKGTRLIAHPSRELKLVQRFIVSILDKLLPIHTRAFAYRKGISIRDNALEHKDSNCILKMDFANFFPSITPEIFFDALDVFQITYSEEDKFLLERFIFWSPKRGAELELSIGAPSSPLVSNFIMHRFDEIIYDQCTKNSVIYTRYADDITFSADTMDKLNFVPSLVGQALKEIFSGAILINEAKTRFYTKKFNRSVTGIVITNERMISLGRAKKREISVMIHKFSLGLVSDKEVKRIKGYIAYAKHIEPLFVDRMIRKYGDEVMSKLVNLGQ